jgi:hypothetical protein
VCKGRRDRLGGLVAELLPWHLRDLHNHYLGWEIVNVKIWYFYVNIDAAGQQDGFMLGQGRSR